MKINLIYMSVALDNRKYLQRKTSLECTCELIKLTPHGIHKKCSARCDFCSERRFITALRAQSAPAVSIFDDK